MVQFEFLLFALLSILIFASSFQLKKDNGFNLKGNLRDLQMISHGKGFNKLGLPADQRKALLRSLTTEVIRHGRITTTLARAKELRSHVDHMITLAKKGSLHHRRQAMSWIYDKDLVASLFEQAPERYVNRQGGYCRLIKEKMPRRGDNAKLAVVELV